MAPYDIIVKMNHPRVAIIVLNFNGLKDTIHCLKSLLKTKYPNFRVIVADNGSKIDESKILAKKFRDKRFRFIRLSKNLGFSGGNNEILKNVKDKYVVLLNNDTEVTPKWLDPLAETLENDAKIAVVQPKILWMDNKKYFDYAGACGGFLDMFGYPFTRGRIFYTQEKDEGQYDKACDIAWASGAAMIIRKRVLDNIGFLDERFFNYMEEIDLCLRINRAGYRIVSEPKSIIYHKGASTASKNLLKKRFWEHRNNLFLILKNYPANKLLYVLPARILMEYISILHYLRKQKFTYAAAALLSQLSLIYYSAAIFIERAFTRRSKAQKENNSITNKSVALEYFILKKRKYSDIMR